MNTATQAFTTWQDGMPGIHKDTQGWFIARNFENTIVAGIAMQVLWAHNIHQPKNSSGFAVAKNARDILKLRPLTADEAHEAFEKAIALFTRPKPKYKTLKIGDYKSLPVSLFQSVAHPTPENIAKALLEASYYFNISRKNPHGGSVEFRQLQDSLYNGFSRLMRAVYGDKGDQQLADILTLLDTLNDEKPSAVDFKLKRSDVIIGTAPGGQAATLLAMPEKVAPADAAPTADDIAAAFAGIGTNPVLENAADQLDRGTFLSVANMLLPPEKRLSLVMLGRALDIDTHTARSYLQAAKAFLQPAPGEKQRPVATAEKKPGIVLHVIANDTAPEMNVAPKGQKEFVLTPPTEIMEEPGSARPWRKHPSYMPEIPEGPVQPKLDFSKPETPVQDISVGSGLPGKIDTGDFTIDNDPVRGGARINGDRRLSEKNRGILVELFNRRGNVVTARELGEKFFPGHAQPEKTVYAAIFNIRKLFAAMNLPAARQIISNAPQRSGYIYTGPNAPKAQ